MFVPRCRCCGQEFKTNRALTAHLRQSPCGRKRPRTAHANSCLHEPCLRNALSVAVGTVSSDAVDFTAHGAEPADDLATVNFEETPTETKGTGTADDPATDSFEKSQTETAAEVMAETAGLSDTSCSETSKLTSLSPELKQLCLNHKRFMLSLEKIRNKHNTDLSLFDEIIDLVKSHSTGAKLNFTASHLTKRKKLMSGLESMFETSELKPVDIPVKMSDGSSRSVAVFDIEKQILLC